MVIDRKTAIGEGVGLRISVVCVGCVGRVSLPRDKCPWHRHKNELRVLGQCPG